MHVPKFNAISDTDEIRGLVRAVGAAELVTVDDGFPVATLLPVLWDGDRLIFHMARANPQWRSLAPGSPALAVVTGAQAYVSASWYVSKSEHGRVVPTWNYTSVHLSGRLTVHDDPQWLHSAVSRLTDLHEDGRDHPWSVTDAPTSFVEQQLRAIIGLELVIEKIEAKAKLSQNRSSEDRMGVVAGLRGEAELRSRLVADSMGVD